MWLLQDRDLNLSIGHPKRSEDKDVNRKTKAIKQTTEKKKKLSP